MLYGAKPRLLMELDFPRASDVDPASEHDAAVERHMLTVSELFLKEQEKKLQNLKAAQQYKNHFDKKHKSSIYAVDTEVLKYDRHRDTRQGDKLKPRYIGPCIIAEGFGKGV